MYSCYPKLLFKMFWGKSIKLQNMKICKVKACQTILEFSTWGHVLNLMWYTIQVDKIRKMIHTTILYAIYRFSILSIVIKSPTGNKDPNVFSQVWIWKWMSKKRVIHPFRGDLPLWCVSRLCASSIQSVWCTPCRTFETLSAVKTPQTWISLSLKKQTDPIVHSDDAWLHSAHYCELKVKVFFLFSSPGSGDPQVCDKWENKGILFGALQLMALTVTQGQEAAQLRGHCFCVRSW